MTVTTASTASAASNNKSSQHAIDLFASSSSSDSKFSIVRMRVSELLAHHDVLGMRTVCKRWKAAIDAAAASPSSSSSSTAITFPIVNIWLHEKYVAACCPSQDLF
jgi:hypothetical protein